MVSPFFNIAACPPGPEHMLSVISPLNACNCCAARLSALNSTHAAISMIAFFIRKLGADPQGIERASGRWQCGRANSVMRGLIACKARQRFGLLHRVAKATWRDGRPSG